MDAADTVPMANDVPDNSVTALEVVDTNQANRRWLMTRQVNVWSPPTDVFEADDRLVVMVEIAGMRDSEFSVTLQERRLSVSGVRSRVAHDLRSYQQMEVRYGEFRSDVLLPWLVDREHVSAVYRDGFLRIELPRIHNQQIQIVDVDQDSDDN